MPKDFDPFAPPEQPTYRQPGPPNPYANPYQPGQSYPPGGQSYSQQPPYPPGGQPYSQQPFQPPYQQPPEKNHSTGIIVGIVVAIILICCCCSVVTFTATLRNMTAMLSDPAVEPASATSLPSYGQPRKVVDLKLNDSIDSSVLKHILTPTAEQKRDSVDSNIIATKDKTLLAVEASENASYIMAVGDEPGSNIDIEYRIRPVQASHVNLITYQDQVYLIEQMFDANGALKFSVYVYPDDFSAKDSKLELLFEQSTFQITDDDDSRFSEFEFFDSENEYLYAYLDRKMFSSTSYAITQPIVVAFDFAKNDILVFDLFADNYSHEIKPIAVYNGYLYYLELSNTGYGSDFGTLCKQYLSTNNVFNEITEFSTYSSFRDSFTSKSGQGFLIVMEKQDYNQDIYVFDMSVDQAFLVIDTAAEKYQTPDIAVVPGGFLYTDIRSDYEEEPIDLTPDDPDDDWLEDGRNSIFLYDFETGASTLIKDSPFNWSFHLYGATNRFVYCWMVWRSENVYRLDWTDPERAVETLRMVLETTT